MVEIVLPEEKPAWEWVLGRALQKMSPKRRHARLQGQLMVLFEQWNDAPGQAASGKRVVLPDSSQR